MIYEEKVDEIGRFLLLAIRGSRTEAECNEFTDLYRVLGYGQCWEGAMKNQVGALVAHALVTSLPENRIEPEWSNFLRANEQRVSRLHEALLEIATSLNSVGCRFALEENAGVMYGTDMPLASFCAGDFDMLVDRVCWEEVQNVFFQKGFLPRDRRNRPTNRLEFCRILPDGNEQWINAGYLPFDRMWVPLSYIDRTKEWLARRIPSHKCEDVYVLAPEDSLAFVAMHTSLHSYIRAPGIRLHVDVDRTVRDNQIDWGLFLTEVKTLGVPTRAFVSLAMAKGLLDTPIPEEVIKDLYPGKRRWEIIQFLLNQYCVFHNGKKKLPHISAFLLDMMIAEHSPLHWLSNVLVPNQEWMVEHFAKGSSGTNALWLLHLKRIHLFLTRWHPQ